MRSKEELKALVIEAIDKRRGDIIAFGDAIAAEPELGFKEFKTSEKFIRLMDELGFQHRDNVAITGVVADVKTKKEAKYNVAVMGELDAIYVPGHPDADPCTGAVHACGHNNQMAALAGVAYALKDTGIIDELDGDVTLMAVPAEEFIELEYRNTLKEQGKLYFFGGKEEFIRLGEFDNVDCAIMQHTTLTESGEPAAAGSNCNGFVGKLVKYTGKEAHAGAAPHEGVNALNAAMLGLMAIHAQREMYRDEDHIRIHPIITKGGDIVNVVPADVRIETYVRGSSTKAILDASEKVNAALKSGADAIGCKIDINEIPGYLPSVIDDKLTDIMYENQKAVVGDGAVRIGKGFGGGSSDQGDVSQIIPSIQAFFAGATGGLHKETYVLEDKELASVAAAKCLAMTVIDLLYNGAEKGLEIKNGFKPTLTKEEYLTKWGRL